VKLASSPTNSKERVLQYADVAFIHGCWLISPESKLPRRGKPLSIEAAVWLCLVPPGCSSESDDLCCVGIAVCNLSLWFVIRPRTCAGSDSRFWFNTTSVAESPPILANLFPAAVFHPDVDKDVRQLPLLTNRVLSVRLDSFVRNGSAEVSIFFGGEACPV